jgi:hypothetical protein
MRIPSWLLVIAAVLAAFPFGWGLGVFVAYLVAGKNFGQLPVLTVPLGIAASHSCHRSVRAHASAGTRLFRRP